MALCIMGAIVLGEVHVKNLGKLNSKMGTMAFISTCSIT
jgi:hypothetical protein